MRFVVFNNWNQNNKLEQLYRTWNIDLADFQWKIYNNLHRCSFEALIRLLAEWPWLSQNSTIPVFLSSGASRNKSWVTRQPRNILPHNGTLCSCSGLIMESDESLFLLLHRLGGELMILPISFCALSREFKDLIDINYAQAQYACENCRRGRFLYRKTRALPPVPFGFALSV